LDIWTNDRKENLHKTGSQKNQTGCQDSRAGSMQDIRKLRPERGQLRTADLSTLPGQWIIKQVKGKRLKAQGKTNGSPAIESSPQAV